MKRKRVQWAAVLEEEGTTVEWAFKEQLDMDDVQVYDSYEEAMEAAVSYLETLIRGCKKQLKWLENQTEESINKRMEDMGVEEWCE